MNVIVKKEIEEIINEVINLLLFSKININVMITLYQ